MKKRRREDKTILLCDGVGYFYERLEDLGLKDFLIYDFV